jgi:hypothetical protein
MGIIDGHVEGGDGSEVFGIWQVWKSKFFYLDFEMNK